MFIQEELKRWEEGGPFRGAESPFHDMWIEERSFKKD